MTNEIALTTTGQVREAKAGNPMGEPLVDDSVKPVFERWLATRDKQVAERVWDEAVRALAWAADSGPEPLQYVTEHNPYREA